MNKKRFAKKANRKEVTMKKETYNIKARDHNLHLHATPTMRTSCKRRTISIVLVLVLLCMLCAGCSANEAPDDAVIIPNRFVEIDMNLNGYAPDFDCDETAIAGTAYVVDRYSKAVYMYYFECGGNSGLDFIPLYNPDGTIMIYDGNLPD